jgi:hypothetical protein
MKKLLFPILITCAIVNLNAEGNVTTESNLTKENNTTIKSTDNKEQKINRTQKHLEEQMKREEKYAKEQRFYQGDEYDLSAVEVNQDSIDSTPLIEPDYDFEIDDVYRDDI